MSRRTADANRAIREAWEREKQLVLEGKGTRDWTPEQQQSIIDKGKAYDTNGRAFEGQHMKSVEEYPEHQGNPDNIQFLTKEEHLEAHKGSWQNPTNWYYDPVTKEYTLFDVDELVPCAIIELSDPVSVVMRNVSTDASVVEDTGQKEVIQEPVATKTKQRTESLSQGSSHDERQKQFKQPQPLPQKRGFFDKLHNFREVVTNTAKSFCTKHPALIKAIEFGTAVIVINEATKHSGSSGNGDSERTDYSYHNHPGSDDSDSSNGVLPEISGDPMDAVDDSESSGTPKSPHPRRGYLGHRWKKNENGDRELTETWIKETFIHGDKVDNESKPESE